MHEQAYAILYFFSKKREDQRVFKEERG